MSVYAASLGVECSQVTSLRRSSAQLITHSENARHAAVFGMIA